MNSFEDLKTEMSPRAQSRGFIVLDCARTDNVGIALNQNR